MAILRVARAGYGCWVRPRRQGQSHAAFENAQKVTLVDDLLMIHTKISKSLGHEKFNEVIREKLMAHLVHCAIHVDVEPPPRNGASKVTPAP